MKNLAFTASLFLLYLLCSQCTPPQPVERSAPLSDDVHTDLPEWASDAAMYEMNIRQFTAEGTFKAIIPHLDRIEKMGVEIIWLMPISPISMTKRKGSLGSYYSISDFRAINPEYGTAADLHQLIREIHERDMKVIVDWVPHHTGWDHPWISEHPEYYSQDRDGNIVDPINEENGQSWGWTDVAELDLESAPMRKQITADMIYWITEFDVDGFRVDHAHRVPLDYWQEVIPQVKKAKDDIFLLAEGEDAWLKNRAGFHATYAWQLHHAMNDVAAGKANANVFDFLLWKDRNEVERGFHLHFTSNHDENSWAGTVFERMGPAYKAMAVLSVTLEGMPLLYSGQEAPLRKRLEFFEKDAIDWGEYKYADFYSDLFHMKKENPALWNAPYGGQLRRINDSPSIFAFQRESEANQVTVILNLSETESSTQLEIPGGSFEDALTGAKYTLDRNPEITLKPWTYQVLVRK